MIKRLCAYCGIICWHNPMRKLGEYRCTHCGDPVRTNISGKKEYLEDMRRRLAKRLV